MNITVSRTVCNISSLIRSLLFVLAAGMAQPAASEVLPLDGPGKLIDQFHATLLALMKSPQENNTRRRYNTLEPELMGKFDLNLMTAIATGNYWYAAQEGERSRLTEAFRKFSTATYASRFSSYSGQSFKTLKVQAGPRKTQLVRTELQRPNASPIALTYVTRFAHSSWWIVDVLVNDGISELAVRRSEFQRVLKTDGIKGLIQLLEEKTKKLLER